MVICLLKEKLSLVPKQPGCYLMYNKNKQLIYVGKAKNLKNRLSSYFVKSQNGKTALLVNEIADFEYVITRSEYESLVLEINLIKNHQPKYNIQFTDDKTYPYIEITKEKHPRLIVSRMHKYNKGRILFGPFPSVYQARETVKLLHILFPLRRCNPIGKRPCIYYQIGQCLGPCATSEEIDYEPNIKKITNFLKGDTKEVINTLKEKMNNASKDLNYEKAIEYKYMIESIETTTEKQIISLNDFIDRDVIGYEIDSDAISICIFQMRQGRILDTHQKVISALNNDLNEVVQYIYQFYESMKIPEEIIVDTSLSDIIEKEILNTKVLVPKIGAKKKILDLAILNAKEDLEKEKALVIIKENNKNEISIFLKELTKTDINTVEAFDNAQLFSTNLVGGMIVLNNQKFIRKNYRKFKLKTTTNDDYQAMYEIVYRRYHSLLINNLEMPDLVIVDGGKGQVNKALKALEDLNINIPVLGLQKDNNHKFSSVIFNGNENKIKVNSPIYRFFGKISEEVHRYTIDFHRQKRGNELFTSELDQINGLGKVRKELLLKNFSSLDEIKLATISDLVEIGIPVGVAEKVKEVFKA